jgi:hypothetical protein
MKTTAVALLLLFAAASIAGATPHASPAAGWDASHPKPADTTPTITVNSPIAGDAWNVGDKHHITWVATNIPSTCQVGIVLFTTMTDDFGTLLPEAVLTPQVGVPNAYIGDGHFNARVPSVAAGTWYVEVLTLCDGYAVIAFSSPITVD